MPTWAAVRDYRDSDGSGERAQNTMGPIKSAHKEATDTRWRPLLRAAPRKISKDVAGLYGLSFAKKRSFLPLGL